MMGYWYGPCGYGGWGLLWSVFWIALLVLGFYLLFRALSPKEEDRALKLLRERYARGEIDQETFERMKRDLS